MSQLKKRFLDLFAEVMAKSEGNKDATVKVGELIEGYAGSSTFQVEQGEFILSKGGFRQLGDHIGFPSSAIARLDSDPGLQRSVLRHVVADDPDRNVNLRITGNQITHVVSDEHVLLKNSQVMMDVNSLIIDGILPPHDEVKIGTKYISRDGRSFSARLLCPEMWNYDVSINGKADPVYGSMYISNSEHGIGAFKCGAALARIACFNWTIGKYQMAMDHRYHTLDEFRGALQATSKLIGGYSEEMVESLRDARRHHLDRPELVFEKVAERLRIPAWAVGAGREYLDQQTDSDNVFDVVQAVTHASQSISKPEGRRIPRWDLRDSVEQDVMQIAQEIILTGEEGFVTTVGDVMSQLGQYDPLTEAVGFSPISLSLRGREVITNE